MCKIELWSSLGHKYKVEDGIDNVDVDVNVPNTRKAVDADGDGEITEEEFVTHALKSRFMKKMLEN